MFLHPFGLLALAAVPAVVALHLFRRRVRPRTVSATFLWSAQDRTPAAGRRREPLRRSLSFWCEVLAALLLALAFASPRPFGSRDARHLVVVLDQSASMAAIDPEGSTRARAVAAVRERIAALPSGSRVTLIGSGARPVVLAGPGALPLEARAALDAYAPGRANHELNPALGLALELAGARAVTVVTDRFEEAAVPPEVELVAVGAPAPNVGIVAAARRRSEGAAGPTERASLTVANFSSGAAIRTLLLETEDGVPLATRALELRPGADTHVSFELPEDTPLLVARLAPPAGQAAVSDDGLALDDVAWLAPAPRRTLRLASTLPPELGALLGVDAPANPSNIDRWLALVPDAIDTINPSAAHLVLATGLIGGDAWVLGVAAPGAERAHFIGPFLTDAAHRLLDGVTLEGVVWSADPSAALQGAPIVSAGELTLASEVRDGARVGWLLNFDPARSNLQRSPDWPILLANAAEARRAALPGALATTLSLGEPFRYRVLQPTTLEWRGALGPAARANVGATAAHDGAPTAFEVTDELLLDDIELPGVYELATREGALVARVAVSLCDGAESNLAARSTGARAATEDEASLRAGFSWVEVVLLVSALALLAVDWRSLS